MEVIFTPDRVRRYDEVIPRSTRDLISNRYKTITKAINKEFWNSNSDINHSLYVGSYGRGTAVNTSDIDILLELPDYMYDQFNERNGNVQSQLLQTVKNAIISHYRVNNIHADGQIIYVEFFDGIRFELLPAFAKYDMWGHIHGYKYADSNSGGKWRSTDPKDEQIAIRDKNHQTNELCIATCRHIRAIRDSKFTSYKLSGIVIDSFVYRAIGNWHFLYADEDVNHTSNDTYEDILMHYFNGMCLSGYKILKSPGSNQDVDATDSFDCLAKVLEVMCSYE